MSFLQKVQSSRNELLWLVRGKDRGMDCWHYILVEKSKLPMFKVRVKTDFIQLDDYGQVIESGWGKNPPEEIEKKIKEQFGG